VEEFSLGETVYQITYCSCYSDRGYSYRKTYIKRICKIQELGEEDRIEYATALQENDDRYITYLDIVKTELQAQEKVKELQNG
jgi:hypothetical protein